MVTNPEAIRNPESALLVFRLCKVCQAGCGEVMEFPQPFGQAEQTTGKSGFAANKWGI